MLTSLVVCPLLNIYHTNALLKNRGYIEFSNSNRIERIKTVFNTISQKLSGKAFISFVRKWKKFWLNMIFVFFLCQYFFSWIFISKMSVKINLMVIRKHHGAYPEKGFLIKSILNPNSRTAAMPTAWKLSWVQLSRGY